MVLPIVPRVLGPLMLFLVSTNAALDCRPPGPVVPIPRNISEHPILLQATNKLTRAIESVLAGEIQAGWPVENTSFSIGLVTHDQPDAAVPVWEYHHLAPTNVAGTKELTRHSQYLIGSVSKVISDYILLRSGIDLDESVVSLLPELADPTSRIAWGDITLRHLANQVAGIPSNYGFSEYYYLKDYFESLGFPHIEDDAYGPCGIIGLSDSCTRQQLLKGMVESYPISRPSERPVYSNVAFTLPMYAVQDRTNMTYGELLETYVTGPLGLANTMTSPGDDDKAVIPPVDNSWGSDYGENTPGGGLVSSLSGLSIFLHGILDRTILDSDSTAIREWLKPTSSTGSLNALVGAPWEIFRTNPGQLTPDHPHVVDVYAKGGAAYGYQSQIAVVDEYGVAFVIFTAGSVLAVAPLYDAVLTTLVPALDEIAREQVGGRGYVGDFVDDDERNIVDFNVTIVQDTDSLVLQGIDRNGTDTLASFAQLWSVTVGAFVASRPTTARIFPVDIRSTAEEVSLPLTTPPEEEDGATVTRERRKIFREDWRVEWDLASTSDTELPGADFSARTNCLAWTLTDWMYYGSEPLDRIVFLVDADTGTVVGLEIPFLRSRVLVPGRS